MTLDDLVPEGVDARVLASRKAAPSSTPESKRKRCPECASTVLSVRTGHPAGGRQGYADADYQCEDCRAFLDAEEVLP